MQLQPAQLSWNEKVSNAARHRGFTVYVQNRSNVRTGSPSLILTRGLRVIHVWLRTGRRKPVPIVDEFVRDGHEAHLWYPQDWPFVLSTLLSEPTPPAPKLPDRDEVTDRAWAIVAATAEDRADDVFRLFSELDQPTQIAVAYGLATTLVRSLADAGTGPISAEARALVADTARRELLKRADRGDG